MIDGILLKILVAAAILLSAACAAMTMWPLIREQLDRFQRLGTFGKVVVSACLCFCCYYGGSKSISILSKTGHDTSIGLVDAQYATGDSATNMVPAALVSSFGHGTNIVAYAFMATNTVITPSEMASKVWWRESNSSNWTNMATGALPAGLEGASSYSLNGTTSTVYFVFGPTNSWEHNQIYIGDDLPPVYIETEGGITLDSLVMTSKKATVTYTVDAEALTGSGQVVFERMWKGGSWQTVRTVEAVAGQHVEEFGGFMVRIRSMWRIRLLVEVEN